jgi:hypothetical protein
LSIEGICITTIRESERKMLIKIFLLVFVIENVLGISVPGKVLETKLGKIVGVDSE